MYVNLIYLPLLITAVVVHQVQDAYKYWDVQEHSTSVAQFLMDWIREEVEKEISDIKATILNLKKTTLTVYDPEHGEIQAEIHLPIPVKSLDVIPEVNVDFSRLQKYVPEMPTIQLPTVDVTKWLPPYDG